ncbi:MAG: bsaA [Bacillales bacterium]|nr:bsaA [Bacillales bacterium]
MAFPCNQFANQEPGNAEEIKNFCKLRYDTSFPIFQKIDVKGENAHPLYKYLTEQKKGILGGVIKWNFTKFLIDKEGRVVERFAPITKPLSIEDKIKKLIYSK